MIKIAHVADLHMGYRQYGMQERFDDFNSTAIKVADAAIAEKVDAVVFAGDIFHVPRPPAICVDTLQREVGRLWANNIAVFGIV